ncbi:STM4015 family protein [Actinomadura algeriensis]|uniref:Leucine-rich repeat domain-containing protein n=1 Tax=Actinomadura algeriensis TaxID=1679523 RepID=A0ABR9K4Y3_9ACTN|nr:STM4015 family protein [Actinomadura algeriensis]MBE1537895.1 hypothetical protein [Actinomadura algeriensis]
MALWEHLGEYEGLPVFEFGPERLDDGAAELPEPPPAGDVAWRLSSGHAETAFRDLWRAFCASVDTTEVTALVFGYWGADYDSHFEYPVPLLAEAAAAFPKLRSVFLGDITSEESEISWIDHRDLTPIFREFPNLEHLEVRGADGLVMDPVEHSSLRLLRFESGGLPAQVVRAVAASDLPELVQLDLWFGEEYYGGDATAADLAPILSGERLPALLHLGLEDARIQDEIAEAVAGAPIVARLATLSLAMGALTDRGAEALLSGQPLTHLEELDLRHHYLSESMMERVRDGLPGVLIDLTDRQEPYEGEFFIQVSE